MASSTVKLAADISSFKSEISAGQNVLRGLKAELKATDAEFKATGNAEQKLASQTKTLNSQFEIQRGIADQARQALEKMANSGVKETDAAYQQMYATMMNATAGMNEAQAALNALNVGAEQAATGANDLTKGLNGISKKISLDQVISGIDKITDGLENAAKKAIKLGEDLWNTIMDSARRADDTATMAEMYGIDLDTFMRMQKLVAGGMDTSVDAMLSSQDRLKKGVGKGSKEVMEYLQELHVGIREGILEDWTSWKQKDPEKLFWEAGQALMNMSDAYDKEAAAQTLFGKSWKELVPLFNSYKSLEEYNKALEEQTVNTEETVRDLAALNDAVGKLEGSWTTFKDELIGAIAPALTKGADAISGLLNSLTDYLKTEQGQKLLEDLGTAVSDLFAGIEDINAEELGKNVASVLTGITDGLKWLSKNGEAVKTTLIGIVGAWGTMVLGDSLLKVIKLVDGIKGLTTGGAASAGAAAGSSWATSFAASASSAIASIAPWLASVLGVTALAIAPERYAHGKDIERWQTQYNERAAAAALGGPNSWFINQANDVFGLTGQTQMDTAYSMLMGLSDRQNQQRAELYNLLNGRFTSEAGNTWNALTALWGGAEFDPIQINAMLQDITDAMAAADSKPQVTIEPVVPDNAASEIGTAIGPVPVTLVFGGFGANVVMPQANGIWSVPRDNYLAALHKGERVVPAREVQSRSYNSNLYVESMIMNNGTDAAGLASAMAAAQRRQMSGFGS